MRAIATLTATLGACWIALTAMSAPAAVAPHVPLAPGDVSARRPLETGVIEQINFARQFPREYARMLRQYRNYIRHDGILFLPGDTQGIYTYEGRAAVDEAIAFMERQAPLPPLTEGQILTLAARDHADEQGWTGEEGHLSRNGATPSDRVRRRGGDVYVGEGISYGFADAGDVVRQLIIDDGVPDRGHRTLLFTADFRFAGVGCGRHRTYLHMCVVDLSGTATGAPAIPQDMRNRGARTFVYRGQ